VLLLFLFDFIRSSSDEVSLWDERRWAGGTVGCISLISFSQSFVALSQRNLLSLVVHSYKTGLTSLTCDISFRTGMSSKSLLSCLSSYQLRMGMPFSG